MLFNIIDPDKFEECLDSIENAFYCSAQPQPQPQPLTTEEINLKELYKVISYGMRKNEEWMKMPYLDSYYKLFLKRKDCTKDVTSITSSEHEGNYYHFINVVAALARLIIHFKDGDNVDAVFGGNRDGYLKLHEDDRELLVYRTSPDNRTFKLMLAGFYHDLGKTITDPRHPMEGAIILACHTTDKRLMLDKIAKRYKNDFEIKRDDFLYIADLVLFHDQYGTLSTGEDGYMTLVNVIDKMNRYSLNPDHEINNVGIHGHIERCKKYIFDLWLLNVADIMVSLDNKFEKQMQWRNSNDATDNISKFFRTEKGARLRHDLEITFDLLKKHLEDGKSGHCDDLNALTIESHNWSKRHSVERLRRLVTELLGPAIKDIKVMILVNYFPPKPSTQVEKQAKERRGSKENKGKGDKIKLR